MLPLKDAYCELAGTIVNASLSYDVWWELQNADNHDRYRNIVAQYPAFFEAQSGAHLVAVVVLLYQAHEPRTDTQNFHHILDRLEIEDSHASTLVVDLRQELFRLTPTWRNLARARSTAIAHLSNQGTSEQLMQVAEITPNLIRSFICDSKDLLRKLAAHFGILGWAALDMSATGDTKRLMIALENKHE